MLVAMSGHERARARDARGGGLQARPHPRRCRRGLRPLLPAETLESILDNAGEVPVFLDPVSTAYAHRAQPLAGRFSASSHRMELAILAGMDTDTDAGIERAADALIAAGHEVRRRQPGRARLLLRRRYTYIYSALCGP